MRCLDPIIAPKPLNESLKVHFSTFVLCPEHARILPEFIITYSHPHSVRVEPCVYWYVIRHLFAKAAVCHYKHDTVNTQTQNSRVQASVLHVFCRVFYICALFTGFRRPSPRTNTIAELKLIEPAVSDNCHSNYCVFTLKKTNKQKRLNNPTVLYSEESGQTGNHVNHATTILHF